VNPTTIPPTESARQGQRDRGRLRLAGCFKHLKAMGGLPGQAILPWPASHTPHHSRWGWARGSSRSISALFADIHFSNHSTFSGTGLHGAYFQSGRSEGNSGSRGALVRTRHAHQPGDWGAAAPLDIDQQCRGNADPGGLGSSSPHGGGKYTVNGPYEASGEASSLLDLWRQAHKLSPLALHTSMLWWQQVGPCLQRFTKAAPWPTRTRGWSG
jgi:hypothetical protein